jgi:predicted ArsR family transcriptional regulator
MRFNPKKIERIDNEILKVIQRNQPIFTFHIANALDRDDEFVKRRTQDLLKKGLIEFDESNKKGKKFKARKIWRLTEKGEEKLK